MKSTVCTLTILLLSIFCYTTYSNYAAAQDYTKWGLPQGAKARLGKGMLIGNIALSPDGSQLAVCTTIGVWICDTDTGKEQHLFNKHADNWGRCVTYSPDGSTIAVGIDRSDNETLRLINANNGELIAIFKADYGSVRSVAFSADGKTLVSGGNPYIRAWNIATKEQIAENVHPWGEVNSIAFSPDGNTIASTDDRNVLLWDAATGERKATLSGHIAHGPGHVHSVAFSPDGKTVASSGKDKTVILWDVETESIHRVLTGHRDEVLSVAFSPDGQTIVSSSKNKIIRLWNASTGRVKAALSGHKGAIKSVVFSPDGKIIASASEEDGTVKLWDVKTRKVKHTFDGFMSSIHDIGYSPDGKIIATDHDEKFLCLWDAQSGHLISKILSNESDSLAFSPDGKTIIVGRIDGLGLWNVDTKLMNQCVSQKKG